MTAIEYAAQLTIDQYGGKNRENYNQLKKWGMGGLPLRFSTIDYMEDLSGSGIKITPNTHRLYTHQGWDREYTTNNVQKFWTARRNVLLGTLNTIFGFSSFPFLFGYTEECNSLAGIIYYTHLLIMKLYYYFLEFILFILLYIKNYKCYYKCCRW